MRPNYLIEASMEIKLFVQLLNLVGLHLLRIVFHKIFYHKGREVGTVDFSNKGGEFVLAGGDGLLRIFSMNIHSWIIILNIFS